MEPSYQKIVSITKNNMYKLFKNTNSKTITRPPIILCSCFPLTIKLMYSQRHFLKSVRLGSITHWVRRSNEGRVGTVHGLLRLSRDNKLETSVALGSQNLGISHVRKGISRIEGSQHGV